MNSPMSVPKNLQADELAQQMQAGRIVLIDVREPAEFLAERIPGAMLCPLSSFDAKAIPSDGERMVVFHCAGGKRSLDAAMRCLAAGRVATTHLEGGIAAWKAAGLPVIGPGS